MVAGKAFETRGAWSRPFCDGLLEHAWSSPGLLRAASVGIPTTHYATDATDEFRVKIHESGPPIGIFKVYAKPAIAELETGLVGVAAETAWHARIIDKPLSAHQSLEQWRATAEIDDRRLQTLFELRPLPERPEATAVELFHRLRAAFAYSEPFYSLEAIIADARTATDSPFVGHGESSVGGRLDAVAMLLPSALADLVVAKEGNPNGLDWACIDQQVAQLRQKFEQNAESTRGKQFAVLAKIADIAGIDTADVLFAANILQLIPANVGGKVGDVAQSEALTVISNLLSAAQGKHTTQSVAADMNALIRFKNWTTTQRSAANISGESLAYGAVCDTASKLFALVEQYPYELLKPEFAKVFIDTVAPQLQQIDATSAKGRCMLRFLQDGLVNPRVASSIAATWNSFAQDIEQGMNRLQTTSSLVDVTELSPTQLTGGKAEGLRRAISVFGPERVLAARAITSEATQAWLASIPGVSPLIADLNNVPDLNHKIAIGQRILDKIKRTQIPSWVSEQIKNQFGANGLIVMRSSSADEDVNHIGPAPGVYESVVRVDPDDPQQVEAAYKEVLGSFFSEKAISFRELKGLRHYPFMAILVQSFMTGSGGSVFIQDGAIKISVANTPSDINDTSGKAEVEELSFKAGANVRTASSLHLNQKSLQGLVDIAQRAEAIYGSSDFEFALDSNGNVILLQLRKLERPPKQSCAAWAGRAVVHALVETTADLLNLEVPSNTGVALVLGEGIDPTAFQGDILRWLIRHQSVVREVVCGTIPSTCHFMNVLASLGILVTTPRSRES